MCCDTWLAADLLNDLVNARATLESGRPVPERRGGGRIWPFSGERSVVRLEPWPATWSGVERMLLQPLFEAAREPRARAFINLEPAACRRRLETSG